MKDYTHAHNLAISHGLADTSNDTIAHGIKLLFPPATDEDERHLYAHKNLESFINAHHRPDERGWPDTIQSPATTAPLPTRATLTMQLELTAKAIAKEAFDIRPCKGTGPDGATVALVRIFFARS